MTWQLVWSEDENEESLNDATRRLTGFTYSNFKKASTRKEHGTDSTSYFAGEWKLVDYSRKASEIYKAMA